MILRFLLSIRLFDIITLKIENNWSFSDIDNFIYRLIIKKIYMILYVLNDLILLNYINFK